MYGKRKFLNKCVGKCKKSIRFPCAKASQLLDKMYYQVRKYVKPVQACV